MTSAEHGGNPFDAGPFPILVLQISQERIDQYAELSGDYNSLHVDPEFGKRSAFGSTIAHGPVAAAMLFHVVGAWLRTDWPRDSEFALVFTAPVRAGDTVTAQATARGRIQEDGRTLFVVDLRCTNQRGEDAIVGTARIPATGADPSTPRP